MTSSLKACLLKHINIPNCLLKTVDNIQQEVIHSLPRCQGATDDTSQSRHTPIPLTLVWDGEYCCSGPYIGISIICKVEPREQPFFRPSGSAANDGLNVQHGGHLPDSCWAYWQHSIASNLNFALIKSFVNLLSTIISKDLDVVHRSLHHTKRSNSSVPPSVLEKLMLYLICRIDIEETMDAHRSKFFATVVATDWVKEGADLNHFHSTDFYSFQRLNK